MSLPYLGNVLDGWMNLQNIYNITQSIDERGNVVKTAAPRTVMMMLQPIPPEKLKEIPQENRSDSWWTLYIKELDLSLEMNDVIQINYGGTIRSYQIKIRTNWGAYGYCEYSCIEYEGKPAEVSND
jgi:hypothetical protein